MIEVALLPTWLDFEVWNDFRAHRREQKLRMTETAEKYLLRKLEALKTEGHDPNEAMCESIANGWRGVFAPKKPNRSRKHAEIDAAMQRLGAIGPGDTGGHVPKLAIVQKD